MFRRRPIAPLILALSLAPSAAAQPPASAPTFSQAAQEAKRILESAAPGAVVEITTETRTGNASGTGAGAEAVGAELTQNVDTSAPTAALPGGATASGGSAKSRTDAEWGGPSLWGNPLLWVGVAFLVGAGAAVYFQLRRAAMILAALGGTFIVAAVLSGPALFIVAAAGLLAGIAYLWAEYGGRRSHEALRSVVAGVAAAPPDVREKVKAKILEHQDPGDRDTIRAVKRADGIE